MPLRKKYADARPDAVQYEVRIDGLPDRPLAGVLTVPHPPAAHERDEMNEQGRSARSPHAGGRSADRDDRTFSGIPERFARPNGSERSTFINARPYFLYDEAWLRTGFPLGSDLPFGAWGEEGRRPMPLPAGARTFAFLSERALSPDALAFLREAGIAAPAGALPLEASGILLVHEGGRPGGIEILRNGSAAGRKAKIPSESAQLQDLLYAFHAWERGKAKQSELAAATDGISLPGRHTMMTVLSKQSLCAATLRRFDDPVDVPLWRSILMTLAKACGIETAAFSTRRSLSSTILLTERIDRTPDPETKILKAPRLLLSAAALARAPKRSPALGRSVRSIYGGGAAASYLSIADILNREGAKPSLDLPQAWRRMVFIALTGGADKPERWQFFRDPEHWRDGWRLAPAFGFTPAFGPGAERLTLDGVRAVRSPDDCVALARYFGLSTPQAKSALFEMRRVVSGWEKTARAAGAIPREIAAMAPVMEAGF